MPSAAVNEVFVGLIVDMIEALLLANPVHLAQSALGINRSAWIIRRNRYDSPRSWCDGGSDLRRLELKLFVGIDQHRQASCHCDGHFVVKVIWRLQDDFIPWISDGQNRIHEGHVAACSDHESASIADGDPVFSF